MARLVKFSEGEYYHIYQRGTEKRDLFLDENDTGRFMRLLFLCNGTKRVETRNVFGTSVFLSRRGDTLCDIGAYCLMKNHFHMVVHEKTHLGISKFMQKLGTAYSMYFNEKYKRTGTLFEGRFKAKHLDTDEYLKYIFSYIHLNPVELIQPKWKERGIRNLSLVKKHLQQYKQSSYLDYTGFERAERAIIDTNAFPRYFNNSMEFEYFLNSWLNYRGLTSVETLY